MSFYVSGLTKTRSEARDLHLQDFATTSTYADDALALARVLDAMGADAIAAADDDAEDAEQLVAVAAGIEADDTDKCAFSVERQIAL